MFLVLLIFLVPLSVSGYQIYFRLRSLNDRANLIMASVRGGGLSQLPGHLQAVESDLLFIKEQAKRAGPVLLLPGIDKTAKTADQMLKASIDLLSGYQEILSVFINLDGSTDEASVMSGLATADGKKQLLEAIVKNRSVLDKAKVKITAAKLELNSINSRNLTGIFKDKVIAANNLLSELTEQTDVALPLFKYLPELAGLGQEKNYLLLFQNNMELRPTGGFIGSYGLITVKNGEIIKLQTDDIYNLDKYSKDKLTVAAPWPMTAYNNQKYLFLRDANWSPDWPTAAKQINWFWEVERKNASLPPVELDGVIAITPDFIANFLEATGSITVDGVTFDHKNFAIELEQAVEFDYVEKGIATSERKGIIGDLAQEMLKRALASSPRKMLDLWLIMKKNINEKQIIVWLADQELQGYVAKENWSGEVRSAESDYLYVVDANLAALKTDQVMKRNINYFLTQDASGDLIGRAEITYQHAGKAVQALITKYRTYTRVYVPDGAWFLKAYTQDKTGTQNYALLKDVEIGSDFGKKYAGLFLQVEPGASKTLVLEYRLPEETKKMYQNGLYKLLVQKQPGTTGHGLKIGLKFGQLIAAYHADGLPEKTGGKELIYKSDLKEDREFIVKF